MTPSRRTGLILCTIAAMVWAGTAPGIKYLLDVYHVPGVTLAFWRDVFVTIAVMGMLRVRNRAALRVSKADFTPLAILGVVSIGIYHALWIWSVSLNGAAIAVVLIYLFPTFVTIGARFMFGEQLRTVQVIGLLLSLIGMGLLVKLYDPEQIKLNWLGIVVGLTTAVLQAFYVLYTQKAVRTVNPWASLGITMATGSFTLLVMLLAAPLVVGQAAAPGIFQVGDLTAWLILLALAIGPTLGGYALFNLSLQHIPASTGGLILVLEAPTASAIAILFLGEQLVPLQYAGMALIFVSILLPTLWKRAATA
ncbi:MAG: DMT family transporter [Chloroflexales bacterium]|nr:DMT family transporter [Chloroflexales bacterium]